MTGGTPRVSVVMTSYGKSRFIGEAIESVLGQTYAEFELVIVDDCSVDGSRKIAEDYARTDERIRIIPNPVRIGFSRSTNVGIRNARGDAVAFIDADDLYSPPNLEKLLRRMEAEPAPTVVYSDRWKVDPDGNVISRKGRGHDYRSGRVFGDLLATGFGHITAALIPKECFTKVGLYDESMTWAVDYDFALRLAREFPFAYVPEQLYGYRVYSESMSGSTDRMARLRIQGKIIEKYLRESPELLSNEQLDHAEAELLRIYWITGQRAKLVSRGVRSLVGIGFIVRYSGRSLLKRLGEGR